MIGLHLPSGFTPLCVQRGMGPLQLAVTWYNIYHAGEQATHWDIKNKENANFRSLLSLISHANLVWQNNSN